MGSTDKREFIPAGEYASLETKFGEIMVLPTDGEHVNVEVRAPTFFVDKVHFCFALTVRVGDGLAAAPAGNLTTWSSGGTLTPRRKEMLLKEVLARVDAAASGPMAQAMKDARRRVLHNDIMYLEKDIEGARRRLEELTASRDALLAEEAEIGPYPA